MITDLGAGASLIACSLYEKLKDQGLHMRQGIRMRLLQLTGEAKCQGYVTFSLYFQSQLGLVRLKDMEAYVLKDLTVPLLIGEDIQMPWQLHTLRKEGRINWQVGDSEHLIPLHNQQDHSDAYLSFQEVIHVETSHPSGTG